MRSIHKYWLVAGILFATMPGCEDENEPYPDAGGATGGTGGAAGKGGGGGTSGSAGTSGQAGAGGGVAGSGGAAGTGGTAGNGGAAGTGGGKGGSAGTAGASGTGGIDGSAGTSGTGGAAGTAGAGDGGLPDSGTGGTAGGMPDAGPDVSADTSDGGFTLPPNPTPVNPGKGGVLITASGEDFALNGFPYPPANPDDPIFYDGWEVTFNRLLTTIGNVTFSANPDKNPGNQSETDAVVATAPGGPWAVDLHRDGPQNIPGKSPGERAVPFVAINSTQYPFMTNGTRYAFGYDVVTATAQAFNVNLDAAALADYGEMVHNGCTALYVGTATFKGDTTCKALQPNWSTTVNFRLCFKTPTTYINCQNPDNTGMPFPNEDAQRGIAFDANAAVIAQVTFHAEHPFWDSVLHDSPAHFDQYAARGYGQEAGTPMVTLEHTKGVDFTAYRDGLNNAIQWRYCTEPPIDVHPKFTGPMSFDRQSVPLAINNDPRTGLRDYYDFAQYLASTEGHLNADGLCFVRRNYDSPP
jgi:hypothetical protein